jgi:hypothetical protein
MPESFGHQIGIRMVNAISQPHIVFACSKIPHEQSGEYSHGESGVNHGQGHPATRFRGNFIEPVWGISHSQSVS